MKILLLFVIVTLRLCYGTIDDPELGTFGALSRRDRTSTTTSTTTARSIINEKKIDEDEPKEQDEPIQPKHEKSEKPKEKSKEKSKIEKARESARVFIEDRTFGRDGLRNIILGGVAVAVINIAPLFLTGLKTIVNLALPILGLLLFRGHRSLRYFDDFMDMFEDFTNDEAPENDVDEDQVKQDKEVIKTDEYYQPQNYPYPNYDYTYYNTNPYRGYGY